MGERNGLVKVLQTIEQLASRNEITDVLVDFMKSSNVTECQILAYLITGRVAPLFVAAEFNFSEKNLIKVLASIYGENGNVGKMRKELGDIGLVAEEVVNEVYGSDSKVEAKEIYEELWKVINISGTGSMVAKQEIVGEFLARLSGLEARYFARTIVGKLRLGVSDKTILDALSVLKVGDKSEREKLDLAYGVNPDLGSLVHEVLINGIDGLNIEPTPGIPLSSRLVERVKSFGEVFERLGERVIIQPKFDGLRCQAHKGVDYSVLDARERLWVGYFGQASAGNSIDMFDGAQAESKELRPDIKLFSRNLEDMTEMFPEVVEAVAKLPATRLILDGEVIGWDVENQTYAPFQETMSRKRKHGIEDAQMELPVKYFPFDTVLIGDENLVEVDTDVRLQKLGSLLEGNGKDVVVMSETSEIGTEAQLNDLFEQYVGEGLEGLIAKKPGGGYDPGKRNYDWLKLKKSMRKTLVDSVDVVIMGYYRGSGKRADFGMGALLGGVYNPESGAIESTTKIGTGINDQQWGEISERLKSIETAEMPKQYLVDPILAPDVWVLPDVVCSVEADEITLSKVHKAARTILGEKGLALRFPRLIEFDRDKRVEDATSSEELVKMTGFEIQE